MFNNIKELARDIHEIKHLLIQEMAGRTIITEKRKPGRPALTKKQKYMREWYRKNKEKLARVRN